MACCHHLTLVSTATLAEIPNSNEVMCGPYANGYCNEMGWNCQRSVDKGAPEPEPFDLMKIESKIWS